ncbi:methyl-accepting chemotaxis protein [Caballeronia sordidicola]|uniref:methyl-accepting chemotaxis protein n=2 Tax=Caballeronia sordidicola TaxID=196367 RepID=UPI00094D4BB7|nr:methyl-accepting chemotaxis protein [Caballeronia sordidicola]
MTIRKRLIFTLGIALCALIVVGGFGLWRLSQAQQRFDYVQANIIPSVKELNATKDNVSSLRRLAYIYLVSADNTTRASTEQDFAKMDKSVDQHLATYERDDISDDTDRKLLQTDKAALETYRSIRPSFFDKMRAGDQDGAKSMIANGGVLSNASNALKTAFDSQNDYNEKLSNDLREANNAASSSAFSLMLSCIVIAVVLSAGLGVLLLRTLMRALGAEPDVLSEVTKRVAGGDLSPVPGAHQAPAGSVLASMGEMQASLVKLIGQVRSAAESIASGSSQIAAGNVDLSSRTEEQAAALEETAASMEELTSAVKQNSESAQQASGLAATASSVAQKGNAVVSQVVATMADINQSSTKIGDITGIIEGIAFQTNILALNAAVEAARAGEQGRGFAVVASEVRSLAQRSSSAAKEIKDLIASSGQKVRDGSVLAEDAGKTMAEVTHAVARVTDIMQEIAAASGEQSRGIEQVNQAITQMDEVTQQNAALVEEAAAASQSLEDQGRQLNESISFFRLDGAASHGHALSAPVRTTLAKRPSPSSLKRSSIATKRPTAPASLAPARQAAPETAAWETF